MNSCVNLLCSPCMSQFPFLVDLALSLSYREIQSSNSVPRCLQSRGSDLMGLQRWPAQPDLRGGEETWSPPRCPELSPCSRTRPCKGCLLMVIGRASLERVPLRTRFHGPPRFSAKRHRKGRLAHTSREEATDKGGLSSLPVRLINASFPSSHLFPQVCCGSSHFSISRTRTKSNVLTCVERSRAVSRHKRWRVWRARTRPTEGQPTTVYQTSLPNVKGSHAFGFRLTSS